MTTLEIKRLKYLLPSILSLCAMLAAYYSMLHSASGAFSYAAYGVIIAMIFDSLDGRVARLTNACTAFGAALDSLTDMLAYGVAPAIMMYCWGLYRLGKIGYLVCFIFCACAGLRLARFNIMAASIDKRFFQGLSSTMAGGFMVAFILACLQYVGDSASAKVLNSAAVLMVVTALLMVSTFKFYSFKTSSRPSLFTISLQILILILIISAVWVFKGIAVFLILAGYIIVNLCLQPIFNNSGAKDNPSE